MSDSYEFESDYICVQWEHETRVIAIFTNDAWPNVCVKERWEAQQNAEKEIQQLGEEIKEQWDQIRNMEPRKPGSGGIGCGWACVKDVCDGIIDVGYRIIS